MAVQAQFYSENSGFPICFQDWSSGPVYGIENGILFNLPYPPQQAQFQNHQNNQSFGFNSSQGVSSSSTCNSFPSMALSQALNAQLEIQGHEIDCILLSQNERLRHALQDQRREQVATLLNSLESKSLNLIRQKEEDLAKAKKKTKELEECLRKAEIESQAWQRVAKENEAMVVNLTNTLEQVRERMTLVSNKAEDTESCCGPCERREEQELEITQTKGNIMACKSCNSRSSCVLFLPCRHLCCCYFCEALLDSCPVCKSAKEGCMEVFLA